MKSNRIVNLFFKVSEKGQPNYSNSFYYISNIPKIQRLLLSKHSDYDKWSHSCHGTGSRGKLAMQPTYFKG